MTTVFTDKFRTMLYNSLDKTAPIDPDVHMFNPARNVRWVLFRSYASFVDENDPRYTGIQSVSELASIPGWSAPLTPDSVLQPVGATTAGANTYCLANNPFDMGAGWTTSTVVAAALVLDDNTVIYVTDTPFQPVPVMDQGDKLIARPSSVVAGNRPLFSWPVFVTGATTVVPVAGAVAVQGGSPGYEMAYTQHCWMYPQRVNFIANPSFETATGTNHWRTNATFTKVLGTEALPDAPGLGAAYGKFTKAGGNIVVESNLFPLSTYVSEGDLWTIQAMVRGNGFVQVGLIAWEPEFTETLANWSDWGADSEVWTLSPNAFTSIAALRRSAECTLGLVRFECSGTEMHLDNVLVEPDWLKEWQYFDGSSTYGARGDFAWYGGANKAGQTFSTWYNHKRAVTGRLFAWDIEADDYTITDEEVESQGFVYKWVPAGVRVTPHLDVLYPNDPQEVVPNVAGTPVTPYKTGPDDALGLEPPVWPEPPEPPEPPPTYTDVLMEPFNNLTNWAGTQGTIDPGGRTGNALKLVLGEFVGSPSRTYTIPVANRSNYVTLGFAIKLNDVANPTLIALNSDAGVNQQTFLRIISGIIYIYRGANQIGMSSVTLLVNTWYYIEWQTYVADTGGSFTVRVDGTVVCGPGAGSYFPAGDTRDVAGTTPIDTVCIYGGWLLAVTSFWDDMYITMGEGAPFKGSITIP